MSAKTQSAQPVSDGTNRSGRDPRSGRFVKGNRCGRGNPTLKALGAYREAMRAACPPAKVRAIIEAVTRRAIEGDPVAARVVLDRLAGRPREERPEALALDLPDLTTAKGLVDAAGQVARAMAAGEVATDEGQRIAAVLELARRTYETSQLETRIRQLEDLLSEERSDETTHR